MVAPPGTRVDGPDGEKVTLVRDHLRKGFGDISGAMDDTYIFNPGFHFAVIDDG